MKNTKKITLILLILIGLGGCAKVYEDETIEVIRRPQIDLEPESSGWDDGGTETID